jgi:hypothetical protein
MSKQSKRPATLSAGVLCNGEKNFDGIDVFLFHFLSLCLPEQRELGQTGNKCLLKNAINRKKTRRKGNEASM